MVRALKLSLLVLALVVVQTTLLARLNFFGVMPDLSLVAVIIYASLSPRQFANVFAAGAGLIQDALATGIYIHTLLSVLLSNIICNLKEGYIGDDYRFVLGLVLVVSPCAILLESAYQLFVLKHLFSPYYFVFRLIAGTGYNLLFVPLLYPFLRQISRGE